MKGPMPHGRDFLRFAKFGTLQYSCVKPLAAFVALVLAPFGLFQEVRCLRWRLCCTAVAQSVVVLAHNNTAVVPDLPSSCSCFKPV